MQFGSAACKTCHTPFYSPYLVTKERGWGVPRTAEGAGGLTHKHPWKGTLRQLGVPAAPRLPLGPEK